MRTRKSPLRATKDLRIMKSGPFYYAFCCARVSPIVKRKPAPSFDDRFRGGNLRRSLRLNTLFITIGVAWAQIPQASNLPSMISMDDAVRIALAYNQSLRAQRLNIDENKAEEITAALKPNPTFTTLVD